MSDSLAYPYDPNRYDDYTIDQIIAEFQGPVLQF